MNNSWIVTLFLLAGCDTVAPTSNSCSNVIPDANQSSVAAWCADHAISQGEGRTGDTWLASSTFRAVMRTPLASLTNPAVGGGGFVDLALWENEDIIHEITPLFQGGWLKINGTTQTSDSITHTGVIQCWPGESCASEGVSASVQWNINDEKLLFSGPDALLIHPKGDGNITEKGIQINSTLLDHDGEVTSDRGGEFVLRDASWITLSETSHALTPSPSDHFFTSEGAGIIAFEWPSDRSKKHRVNNNQTRTDAFESGITLLIDAPENDVGDIVSGDDVFARQGVTSTHAAFTIRSWPWSSNSKLAGHGAISVAGLSAQDALNILWGGPGIDRYTVADVAWLDHFSTPGLTTHKPTFVWLDRVSGGHALPDWAPWYRWLDAQENIPAMGPFTWVPLVDPEKPSATELERGLLQGRSTATTGPNIHLFVDGLMPGDTVQQDGTLEIEVLLDDGTNFSHLVLIADTGAPLTRWKPRPGQRKFNADIAVTVSWVVAIGWSESGDQWAATSPVWVY